MAEEITKDIEEQLRELLQTLRKYTEGIKAISAITPEGLPIATVFRGDEDKVDEPLFATLGSAAQAMGDRTNLELRNGDLDKVIIQGKKGIFLVEDCGEGALIFLFDKYMNLPQLVFRDIKLIDEARKKIGPDLIKT
jgi:predicted regulator of Ras-like GTPase activity (Roadblock/LC7/MglB family)